MASSFLYFFFLAFTLISSQSTPKFLLRITRPYNATLYAANDHHLNLREVELYDINNNLIDLRVYNYSTESTNIGAKVNNTIDGNKQSIGHTLHPFNHTDDHFFEYKIINESLNFNQFGQLKIFNRIDNNFQNRFRGSYITIKIYTKKT